MTEQRLVDGAGGILTTTLDSLFQQLRAYGLLSAAWESDFDSFEQLSAERFATLDMLARAVDEEVVSFELKADWPLLYQTLDWPSDAPTSGYVGDAHVPLQSIVRSYFGAWTLHELQGPVALSRRLLIAAIDRAIRYGTSDAIKYAFDLLDYGYVHDPASAGECVRALLSAEARKSSGVGVAEVFFGEVPEGTAALFEAEFVESAFDDPTVEQMEAVDVRDILIGCIDRTDNVRDAASFDEWIIGAARIDAMFTALGRALDDFPLAIQDRVVLTQLDEIAADANGLIWPARMRVRERFLDSPLYARFHGATAVGHALAEIGEDWLDRALTERLVIPTKLADHADTPHALQHMIPDLPERWQQVSPVLGPIVSKLVDPRPSGRARLSCRAALHDHTWVAAIRGLDDLNHYQKQALAEVLVGREHRETEKLDLDRLFVNPNSSDDWIQAATDYVEARQEDGLGGAMAVPRNPLRFLAASLDCDDPSQIEDWINDLFERIAADALLFHIESGASARDLVTSVNERPWSAHLRQELAIKLDTDDDLDAAATQITTAIALAPDDPMIWQSAAVIAFRLDRRSESGVCRWIADGLQRSSA